VSHGTGGQPPVPCRFVPPGFTLERLPITDGWMFDAQALAEQHPAQCSTMEHHTSAMIPCALFLPAKFAFTEDFHCEKSLKKCIESLYRSGRKFKFLCRYFLNHRALLPIL